VTAEEIRSEFGTEVAAIVEAATFDESIDDYLDRHYDIYRRCFELGRDAVLVKAADILDNSDYYGVGDPEEVSAELQRSLVTKMEHFIDESEPYIGDEPIHRELKSKFPSVRERVAENLG